jgi:hypothetical protein
MQKGGLLRKGLPAKGLEEAQDCRMRAAHNALRFYRSMFCMQKGELKKHMFYMQKGGLLRKGLPAKGLEEAQDCRLRAAQSALRFYILVILSPCGPVHARWTPSFPPLQHYTGDALERLGHLNNAVNHK